VTGFLEGRPEFRPPLESVVAFAGFGFDKAHIVILEAGELEAFTFGKVPDRFALPLEA
jgi:hypothetical protein